MAALWLLVSTGASLYYAVCLAAPQLTSQSYKDLSTGAIQVPPIVMGCPGPPGGGGGLVKKCLDAARRGTLLLELEKERDRGARGLLIWGSMLAVSAILCRLGWLALRRKQTGAAV